MKTIPRCISFENRSETPKASTPGLFILLRRHSARRATLVVRVRHPSYSGLITATT